MLFRIRNPWGTREGEWTGPWSDKSQEWREVSEDIKSQLQVPPPLFDALSGSSYVAGGRRSVVCYVVCEPLFLVCEP